MRTEDDALLSLQRYVAAALPEPWMVVTELEDEQPERPYAVIARDGDSDTTGTIASPWVVLPLTIYAYIEADTRKAARQAATAAGEALWSALKHGIGDGHPDLVPLYDYDGRDEIRRIAVTGATGGFLAVTFADEDADPVAFPTQPLLLQRALEALPSLGAGQVFVQGKLRGPYNIWFQGARAGAAVPEALTVDPDQLVGPAPATEVSVVVEGSPDPWRSTRDFARVAQGPLIDARPDVGDSRQRTVTCRLRLTWGRAGRVASPEMILQRIGVRVHAR